MYHLSTNSISSNVELAYVILQNKDDKPFFNLAIFSLFFICLVLSFHFRANI